MRGIVRMVLLGSFLGCAGETVPESGPKPDPGLDARTVFVRASLDVRGTRPSAEELDRLASDEAELDAMLDELVQDPRLGARVGTVYAEALQIRTDEASFVDALDSAGNTFLTSAAIAEEPVGLIHYVVAADLPFTEILTSATTVVSPRLLEPFQLETLPEQPADLPPETLMARYKDGRPAAGILMGPAFTWRFTSTVDNAQRGRASALSRALLCEDYLDRPIDFPMDLALTDSESIANAIQTVQACQACHATLDPLGSHFWPYVTGAEEAAEDPLRYRAENETRWMETTGSAPGYFGGPTSGRVDGLAAAMAGDSRFVSCAVRRMYETFFGRQAFLSDEGQLGVHRKVFVESGLSMRALVRSILDDPAYRGRAARSELGGDPTAVTRKLVSPDILTAQLTDLSGHPFAYRSRAATRIDVALRGVVGGSDHGASADPSTGHSLVHRRLAEIAARGLVDGLFPESRLGRHLTSVDLGTQPTTEILDLLAREVLSREISKTERQELLTLWLDVATLSADVDEAWTALLTALLAHPELATY